MPFQKLSKSSSKLFKYKPLSLREEELDLGTDAHHNGMPIRNGRKEMPSTLDGGPEVTPGAQTHLREAVPHMQRLVYPSRCHGADKLARHQRELWSGAKDQGGEGSSACTLYCRHTAHCSERSAGSLRDSIQERVAAAASQYRSEHATSLVNCQSRRSMETSVLITTSAFSLLLCGHSSELLSIFVLS
ncbi:unnamed protein product [Arctogadus glacialis]